MNWILRTATVPQRETSRKDGWLGSIAPYTSGKEQHTLWIPNRLLETAKAYQTHLTYIPERLPRSHQSRTELCCLSGRLWFLSRLRIDVLWPIRLRSDYYLRSTPSDCGTAGLLLQSAWMDGVVACEIGCVRRGSGVRGDLARDCCLG